MQAMGDHLGGHLVALGQSTYVPVSGLPVGAKPRGRHEYAHGEVCAERFAAALTADLSQFGGVAAVDDVFQFVHQRHPPFRWREGAVDEDVTATAGWFAGTQESFDGHLRQRVDIHASKLGDDPFGHWRCGDTRLGE